MGGSPTFFLVLGNQTHLPPLRRQNSQKVATGKSGAILGQEDGQRQQALGGGVEIET